VEGGEVFRKVIISAKYGVFMQAVPRLVKKFGIFGIFYRN
jgi:hypothetical protein